MIDIERGIEEGQSGRGFSSRIGDWRQWTRTLRVNGDQAARAGTTRARRGGLRGRSRGPVFCLVRVQAHDRTEHCIERHEQRREEDTCARKIGHG